MSRYARGSAWEMIREHPFEELVRNYSPEPPSDLRTSPERRTGATRLGPGVCTAIEGRRCATSVTLHGSPAGGSSWVSLNRRRFIAMSEMWSGNVISGPEPDHAQTVQ
jgi:hypothetical protein